MAKVDKITLSVIQAGLQQVCDEMDLSFSRSAFSPVISEANDRSNGIYSAIDGSLFPKVIMACLFLWAQWSILLLK